MKYSYHVSRIKDFYNANYKDTIPFFVDPYIKEHENNKIKNFESGGHIRQTRKDFEKDLKFLLENEDRYLNIIYTKLNEVHGVKYSKLFWDKSIKIFFRRYLSLVYDSCVTHEKYFDEKKYVFKVLDESNFIIPKTFLEQRDVLGNTEEGYEQLFSQYIKCFYPSLYMKHKIKLKKAEKNIVNSKKISKYQEYFKKIKNLTFKKIIRKLFNTIVKLQKSNILILYAYFSDENFNRLLRKSLGKIKRLTIDLKVEIDSNDFELRKRLFEIPDDLILFKFDKYLFFTLKYNFPSLFVESFSKQLTRYTDVLSKEKRVKYIVSEAWIGNDAIALFLAYAKEKYSIKHIHNEHNCLFHMVEGSNTELEIENCDMFYTLGWYKDGNEKVIKGASLFPFAINGRKIKSNKILYLSGFPFLKRAQIHGAYAQSQENALPFLRFTKRFFANLEPMVLSKILYRDYPSHLDWLSYEKTEYIKAYIPFFYKVDNFKLSAKEMMKSSRLVIIDYIATSYLESLIMNIPTIVLYDSSRYFLKKEYEDFFDVLIRVGIFQVDPEKAAKFINDMGDNIEFWWESKEIQEARRKFLDTNIGDPEDAIAFYLSLLEK